MEARKQFTFYRSYYEALSKLPPERRLGALEALIVYALDGAEPKQLDDMQAMAFLLIRPTLDSGRKKAAAGSLGGSKAKRKQAQSKAEKENEIEIEKEAEKENEIEIENEIENEDECLWCEGFERFWDLYPVKVGKSNAMEVWKQIQPDAQTVCDGVRRWVRSEQWKRESGRFIPRAAKFLQERHFEDAPMEKIPMGASGVLDEADIASIRRMLEQ